MNIPRISIKSIHTAMLLTQEQLFLHTVADLRSKISDGSDYSFIRGRGLCRHLITDSDRLYDAVNKQHQIPLAKIEAELARKRKQEDLNQAADGISDCHKQFCSRNEHINTANE